MGGVNTAGKEVVCLQREGPVLHLVEDDVQTLLVIEVPFIEGSLLNTKFKNLKLNSRINFI